MSKMNEVLGLREVQEQKVPIAKALVAEFLGLFLLVFFGCGTANGVAAGLGPNWDRYTQTQLDQFPSRTANDRIGLPAAFVTCVSLAFGLCIASTAQAIGHISGGHFNPAVTFGIMVTGQIGVIKGFLYIVVQFLGGIVGAAFLEAITPNDVNNWPATHLGANGMQPGVAPWQGLIVEFVVTFILVLVVYGVCDSRRDDIQGSIPLAIGLTVTLSHLVSIPFTGAGLNPARSFGPAVVLRNFKDIWVYLIGPFLGGGAAGILYHFVFRAKGVSITPSEV